jgi:hypothetical protein
MMMMMMMMRGEPVGAIRMAGGGSASRRTGAANQSRCGCQCPRAELYHPL